MSRHRGRLDEAAKGRLRLTLRSPRLLRRPASGHRVDGLPHRDTAAGRTLSRFVSVKT